MSIVSASRRAGLPHFGQVVFTNDGTFASGGSPLPVSTAWVSMSGSRTGSWSSGTGTPLRSGRTLAVDDGDRRAPVALAREAPVALALA